MGAAYWIKGYLLAALPLFAILAAVEWYQGDFAAQDMLSAAAWALIAAALFTASRYRRYRASKYCGRCEDIGKPRAPAKALNPGKLEKPGAN